MAVQPLLYQRDSIRIRFRFRWSWDSKSECGVKKREEAVMT
jgi:hypothetical protein